MPILEPLILVGTGRCGSTLLHGILARHPSLAYLTPLCTRLPTLPGLNRRAMQILLLAPWMPRIPVLRRVLDTSEAYPFWEQHCPGFSRPCRDLVAHDLLPSRAESVRAALSRMPTTRRHRLLLKVTGWPRIGYLHALFPDARFVHIRRDGRAVASSWLATTWWDGWAGPSRWRWGELTDEQDERWQAADRSFVALAALGWEILMDAFALARKDVSGDRYLDVSYEELCARPAEVVERVAAFAGLEPARALERRVAGLRIHDRHDAWHTELSPHQQAVLGRTIEPALARHGYA